MGYPITRILNPGPTKPNQTNNTHLAKGGKTATATAPAGTSAKAVAKDAMLLSVGAPPPPGVPGCGEFPDTCPLCWKLKSGIIITMPTIETPRAAAGGAITEIGSGVV